MKATCDSKQSGLLKKFHTLCTKNGMKPDEKSALIAGFGVESSRELSVSQLQRACEALDSKVSSEVMEADMWRKRAMAAIGGWLRLISQPQDAIRIKAIACRATKHDSFNGIPKERLVNVYYLFLQKQKDFKAVDGITKEELETLTYLN